MQAITPHAEQINRRIRNITDARKNETIPEKKKIIELNSEQMRQIYLIDS